MCKVQDMRYADEDKNGVMDSRYADVTKNGTVSLIVDMLM